MKPMQLARDITRSASQQTFWTINLLADRGMVEDAHRAYAYFRWVDDTIDDPSSSAREDWIFLSRQQSLLDGCYQGVAVHSRCQEENMLVKLVGNSTRQRDGLHSYLYNMMGVMAFDVKRRGHLISQADLDQYTHLLAVAVTDAMHHFIGHACPAPHDETRTMAVSAAHITHMLRDTMDDVQAGYFNISREILDAHRITPFDVESPAYRTWVHDRVQLARKLFAAGRSYLKRVPTLRCRLAGLAYTKRFEGLLDTIEQDGYVLRKTYENVTDQKTGMEKRQAAPAPLFCMQANPQPLVISGMEKK